jgi:putative chitinase
MITLQQFKKTIPTNKEPELWFPIVVDFFNRYDINTPNRIAGFMAQCGHESCDFTALEENLNYSTGALNRVFGRYFGAGKRNASEYARNPEKIANYVYMDEFRTTRGALGNTRPGDGWRFRGGGIKQLTGRSNYSVFAKDVGMSPEEAADYVRTKQGALESACWFWKKNNIARFADRDDIDGMSKAINGGLIGIDDRRKRYARAKLTMESNSQPSTTTSDSTTISKGSKGDLVRSIQAALKIGADGDFGPQTVRAVESWQRINRYTSNGILNQKQINQILGRT